jgi:hypothetical protein
MVLPPEYIYYYKEFILFNKILKKLNNAGEPLAKSALW